MTDKEVGVMQQLKQFAALAAVALALGSTTWAGADATKAEKTRKGTELVPASAPRIPHWRDLAGTRYDWQDVAAARATVFLFGSTTCPCANDYVPRMIDLAKRYEARGMRFFLVFSSPGVRREAVKEYVASRGIHFPAIHEPEGGLAAQLGAVATPTAVVLGPNGRTVYRGRIDDNPDAVLVRRHDLREALDAIAAGLPVPTPVTEAIGCSIVKAAGKDEQPATLVEGMGDIDFPITTSSRQAQRFFNQGMAQHFGFNFWEAVRSFREAARLDPECAMAQWGIALSLGMNYNYDFLPDELPQARAAIEKALQLAPKAAPKERALIAALAVRHPADVGTDPKKQRLVEYHQEMGKLYFRYKDDPHIATLYAAAGMDLRPWKLWNRQGEPEPGTMEVVLVLEDVLRRAPGHIGANHYYIHATEASTQPERALPSARRLAELAPKSGHLVHMPAHTFIRVGEYNDSASINRRAIDVDQAYLSQQKGMRRYAGYYLHNLDFMIASFVIEGRSKEAIEGAREMSLGTARFAPEQAPFWCSGGTSPLSVLIRFGKWDQVVRAPRPAEDNLVARIYWHYGRGLAFIARNDLDGAERELRELERITPMAQANSPDIGIPTETAAFRASLAVARPMLAGKLAMARKHGEAAIRHYREAIEREAEIPYTEPPKWIHPVREALGGALLTLGQSAEAEQVFREELRRSPKSGRALFGLMHALLAQNKQDEAERVRADFREAWSRADTKLEVPDL
jgi:tetratricopeptide (TPR) repeat protein